MNELIEQLRRQGVEVTVDGDHKTSEISFEVNGETVIITGSPPLKRKPGFAIGIMWGCTEPSISEVFETEEDRDAELRRMLDPAHEDSIDEEDCFFRVYIDEEGNVDFAPYLNSEIEEWQEGIASG